MRLPTTLTLPAKSWSAHATARPSSQRATSGLGRTLLGLSLPLLLLGLAELAGRQGWVATHLLPPPSELLRTLHALVQQDLATHVLASSARVLAGFAIGSLVGVVLGAAVGLNRHIEAVIDPSLQALRAIPSLAWVPLLLIWLGIDEAPKIVLIALGAFFPVYLGLLAGIRNVDRKWVELGEVHGLGQLALTRRILLPAALPSLFTGLRGGLSLAWMFMVAAELIAASRGIGYLLTDGRETSRPDIVLAAILFLAVLGKLSDGLLKTVEERSLHWRDSFQA
ncbi:ABC transporter permease [Chitinimonas taiwanensis]|uniref:ABC transporter permease n=1 Tax=Chitinimonas taiwanensis TaxID=240412 RepID=UPI0035B137DE